MPLIRSLEGKGVFQFATYPVAAGQTFVAGDFLTVNASGLLVQSLTAGNNLGASAATTWPIGQAMEDARNDAGLAKTAVNVRLTLPGAYFKLPIWNTTAATAIANTNQLGVAYELRYDSAATGFAVAINATTNTKLRVADFDTENFVTASNGSWPWGTSPTGTPISGAANSALTANQYPYVWAEFIAAQSFLGAR